MKTISHATLLLLSLISLTATAADFRALDFDGSCAQVAEREAAFGSQPYTAKLPSGYQFAFHARELDRDVVIGYACSEGKFFRGAYIFDARDGEDATRLYTALKSRATQDHGAPYYDFASADHRRRMREAGATLTRTDTQVAFWKTPKAEAHASVAEPSKDRGWRVSLSYTALSAVED